jgi:hypothetical protein
MMIFIKINQSCHAANHKTLCLKPLMSNPQHAGLPFMARR